ncbi:hypothetical protein EDD85DRAFT_959248 [Armillaria nabsnona]|nr:hypothetical protein EDD85DRAFT_959248 [Armillaria nabsnona]
MLASLREQDKRRLSDVENNSLASDLDSPASYSRSPTPVSASIQNYAKTMDASEMRECTDCARGLWALSFFLMSASRICRAGTTILKIESAEQEGTPGIWRRSRRPCRTLPSRPPPTVPEQDRYGGDVFEADIIPIVYQYHREDQGVVFRAYEPHLATWTPATSVDLLNTAMFSRSRVLNCFRSTVSPRSCPPSADSVYLTGQATRRYGGRVWREETCMSLHPMLGGRPELCVDIPYGRMELAVAEEFRGWPGNLGGTSSEHLDVVVVRPFAGGELTGFEAPRQGLILRRVLAAVSSWGRVALPRTSPS